MELMLEFEAEFPTAMDRDAARRFLNKDGPAFGDEVADKYRLMWERLQDELPRPDSVAAQSSSGLRVLYDMLPCDTEADEIPEELAERIVDSFIEAGAHRVYLHLREDGHNDIFRVATKDGVREVFNREDDPNGWPEVFDAVREEDDVELLATMIVAYQAEASSVDPQ
jgi:hypothetical protein